MTAERKQSVQQTGADIVVQTLQQHGVKHVLEFPARRSTKSSTRWPTPIFRPLSAVMNKTPRSSPAASAV
jgi:hypothetical protein